MNTKIADTNIVLRHLLKDNIEQFLETEKFLLNEEVLIPIEIIAETVFVLLKVYQVPRKEIKDGLIKILHYENVTCPELEVVIKSLDVFEKSNLGYIDCLLYSYNDVKNYGILSFDEGLQKSIQKKKYTI